MTLMTQMTALHEQRLDFVLQRLRATGARSVLDLGCGSGSLLYRLLAESQFQQVVGLEQSSLSLTQARTLLTEHLQPASARLRLVHGSYTDSSVSLGHFEAAAMVETIEHVQPSRLGQVEQVVFRGLQPDVLLMTTPNREYNPLFDLAPGEFREADHKFEWDRARFRHWALGVGQRCGYTVTFGGIGDWHPELGAPTQYALFSHSDAASPSTT